MLEVGRVLESILTAACIGTVCKKLHFQWKTRRMSEGHPSWNWTFHSVHCGLYFQIEPGCMPMPLGMRPDSIYYKVRSGMRRRIWMHLYVTQILNFQQGFFPSWSVSGNYIGSAVMPWKMLSEVQVWAVAAYKCLKHLVWDISHTEEWPCPALVQACMVIQ